MVEGPRALESVREVRADVVVASAADVDAIELCAAIRHAPELQQIPVLLIASDGWGSDDVRRAFAAGADDCVEESIDADVFVARVAALLNRRASDL